MNKLINESLWRQFGASLEMLENAIKLCPEEHWETEQDIWYIAYHCLFFLDYYLSTEPKKFTPPAPYTLSEFDPSGARPDRTYTKQELLAYLDRSRDKAYELITGMTEDIAASRWVDAYKDYSVFEIQIYNLRHVQHHAAQLNMLLRQSIDDAPRWVSIATKQ